MDVVAYVNALAVFRNRSAAARAVLERVGPRSPTGARARPPSPAHVPRRRRISPEDTNIPSIATTPFLILNSNVSPEQGNRLVGSVHSAYFYKSLSLIGEWQYGYGNYASPGTGQVLIPYSGYYVSAGYFLTGEEIERRTRVKPLRPFLPVSKDERRGLGAWELAGRVSQLRLKARRSSRPGSLILSLWSNSATTTELGANWYWNEYIKFYMFWLHADFGQHLVQFRPGQFQRVHQHVSGSGPNSTSTLLPQAVAELQNKPRPTQPEHRLRNSHESLIFPLTPGGGIMSYLQASTTSP